jgi:hypothetical protein
MKTFEEALEGDGWEQDVLGCYSVVPQEDTPVAVVLEPLLFGQWMLKVYGRDGLLAEPVPVYPGGSQKAREMAKIDTFLGSMRVPPVLFGDTDKEKDDEPE